MKDGRLELNPAMEGDHHRIQRGDKLVIIAEKGNPLLAEEGWSK